MSEEVSQDLLDSLICIKCSSELNYFKDKNKLICKKCRHEFRIEKGIPNMLAD